jgi:hypothetical protein
VHVCYENSKTHHGIRKPSCSLWTLRIQFFLAIAAYPLVILMRETHGPTILAARARQMRQAGHPQAWAHHELHQKTTAQLVVTNLIRPMGY